MARIGIIGSAGRMGRALVDAIADAGHSHAGGADRDDDVLQLAAVSDVLVDFSSPSALAATLDAAVLHNCPIVIGTTGLGAAHHTVIDAASAKIAILQTGNTSLGVTLLAQLVRVAAERLSEGWDIEILDLHHRDKIDAPSGTAMMLGNAAAAGRNIDLALHSECARADASGPRSKGAISFAALRGGTVAGDHSVIFAGDGEVITLSHRAENRTVFASGAVTAAQWLIGRKPGRFEMADVLSPRPGTAA